MYGNEDGGRFFDEGRLLNGIQHQIAVAFGLMGKRCEDVPADAEIGTAHV